MQVKERSYGRGGQEHGERFDDLGDSQPLWKGSTLPTKVLLLLNSPDSSMLEGVHSLCIYGFSIHGDECRTWTDYARIVIDPRQSIVWREFPKSGPDAARALH
jgi:hypothetical protein